MSKENARYTAVKLLCRVERSGAYSNILLDEHFSRCHLDERDKRFCAALFYGTLERKLTLDAVISAHCDRSQSKLSDEVRNILRTAIYQLLYMDSVPDSAAVNEAVELSAKQRNPAVKNFVNALLRSFIRDGKTLPKSENMAEDLSLKYSCPQPLVEKWLGELGESATEKLLASSLGRPPVTVKVNTLRTAPDELCGMLESEGVKATINALFPDCLDFLSGSPESTQAFRDGLYHVQDISSRICCEALDVHAGMTVVDLCSAPGGKTFTIAELMDGEGAVCAYDLHEKRARLVAQGAQRLGLGCVTAAANDAKAYNEQIPIADRVLCDVPCSGLGVIRRKPEIKYKPLTEFERLPQVQYEILENAAKYVKVGGLMVYSTCTLSEFENDGIKARFLDSHKNFEPEKLCNIAGLDNVSSISILPSMFDSDGFYIAKFRRTE